MSREFPAHFHSPFTALEIVDGAHVVKTATGHKIPRWGVSTGHDPGGAKRDGVDLISEDKARIQSDFEISSNVRLSRSYLHQR